MKKYKGSGKKKATDIVDALLRVPARSLERKVEEMEAELRERKKLSDGILHDMANLRIQLHDQIERLKYADIHGPAWRSRADLKRDLMKVEESMSKEQVQRFKDTSFISEKLREARSDLERQRQKLKLLDE